MTVQPVVLKIGGHEIADETFLTDLARVVAGAGRPLVIVHGGGKEISELQQLMGIEPRYADGVRITDAESLAIVEMVLCGRVNKRVVRHLITAGVDAVGLSGVDRGLVRARKMPHATLDMAYTGEVVRVHAAWLRELLGQGIVPVLAPICLGEQGGSYNVNADHVAGAVAAALGAEYVAFITNVSGVLVDGALQSSLTSLRAQELIAAGVIHGGMVPKVLTALHTLTAGVPAALITNLGGFEAQTGTRILAS